MPTDQTVLASLSKSQILRIMFAFAICAAATVSVPSAFAWAIYNVLSDNPAFTQYLLYGIPSVLLLLFSVLRNAVVPGIAGMATMYLSVSSAQDEWLLAGFGYLLFFLGILAGVALGGFALAHLLPKRTASIASDTTPSQSAG